MKNHLKDNWIIYLYLLIQITVATLRYKEIIHCKWTYVLMPTWIMATMLLMTFILGYYIGIKEDDFDRNSYRYK